MGYLITGFDRILSEKNRVRVKVQKLTFEEEFSVTESELEVFELRERSKHILRGFFAISELTAGNGIRRENKIPLDEFVVLDP